MPVSPGAVADNASPIAYAAAYGAQTSALGSTRAAIKVKAAATIAPGVTLFSDTFSDGTATGWTASSGNWNVCRPAAGAPYLYCEINTSGMSSAGSLAWDNYVTTVSYMPAAVQVQTGRYRYGGDLDVRVQDANNYDQLDLKREYDASESWTLSHVVAGKFTTLAYGAYPFVTGQTYYLRLTAQNALISAGISTDNVTFVPLGSGQDTTFPTGNIALRSWGPVSAEFGNVNVVSGIAPTPVPTPTPTASPTPVPTATPVPLPTEASRSADTFVDFVGVNSHFDHGGIWQTAFGPISQALYTSGIRHMRDGPNSHTLDLESHGLSLETGFNISTTPAQMQSVMTTYKPDAVEGQNEYDSYHVQDPNWAADLIAQQQVVYDTVRNNPANANIKVLGPSLSSLWNVPLLGNLSAVMDLGNMHDSTCNFNPGTNNANNDIGRKIGLLAPEVGSRTVWVTETASSNDPAFPGCYEPTSITAKYIIRTIAIRYNFGEQRAYFYDLADEPQVGQFNTEGLLDVNGAPKPQYFALKNMLTLLGDPGTSFNPAPLGYTLTGATTNVKHTLLQKRDGSFWLLLWIEASGWNRNNFTPVAVAPQAVTVSVMPSIKAATAYTYDANWNLNSANVPLAASQAQINVTDNVTYLKLSGS